MPDSPPSLLKEILDCRDDWLESIGLNADYSLDNYSQMWSRNGVELRVCTEDELHRWFGFQDVIEVVEEIYNVC